MGDTVGKAEGNGVRSLEGHTSGTVYAEVITGAVPG